MNKVLYIKYGELCLKGNNQKFFKECLNKNLSIALNEYRHKIDFYYDYIIIDEISDYELDELINIIRFIPGFSFLAIAYKIGKDINELNQAMLSILPSNYFSFKVEAKRSDKQFSMNSDEIKRHVGSFILSNKDCHVDVHNPEIKINIEVKQDYIVAFINKIKCTNGLPVGSSGRLLVLLSGGIDSPVAARLVLNRGFNVDFLTFITPPHTSEKVVEKVKMLVNKINLENKLQPSSKLYICNYTPIQNELTHINKENYRITLLRRSFFRIASHLVTKYNYDAIVTGEALGQVASQTIESMNCISQAINNVIIRPLITFDKEKIISLAKEFKTYETSILPFDDSCSLFAPKNPITKPKLDICIDLEKKIDLLLDLEKNIINHIEIVTFRK